MIKLENISKSFGAQRVLNGLNLEIPDGKITVMLGRSGSGKSVTLKHIIGLIKPDSGSVWVDGVDITQLDARKLNQTRRKFGMLFQDGALFDSMSVGENIAFPLVEHTELKGAELENRVRIALEAVGLKNVEEKMPSELSGGMRKRVGLARAIVLQPEIVLYDEPTSGLDPLMTDAINQLIVQTQRQFNLTNFIISHDVEAALRIADKIAVLYEGQILLEGMPAEIKVSQNPFVRAFMDGRDAGYHALD